MAVAAAVVVMAVVVTAATKQRALLVNNWTKSLSGVGLCRPHVIYSARSPLQLRWGDFVIFCEDTLVQKPPISSLISISSTKHLKLKGLRPEAISACAFSIRLMGNYFGHQINALSSAQLSKYFRDLIGTHFRSAVTLALYTFKFYTLNVLDKPWTMSHSIKPLKVS